MCRYEFCHLKLYQNATKISISKGHQVFSIYKKQHSLHSSSIVYNFLKWHIAVFVLVFFFLVLGLISVQFKAKSIVLMLLNHSIIIEGVFSTPQTLTLKNIFKFLSAYKQVDTKV